MDIGRITLLYKGVLKIKIEKAAVPIPIDCIIHAKSLAMIGGISKSRVKTGKATAPPPSVVAPAIKEPKPIVSVMGQKLINFDQLLERVIPRHHKRRIVRVKVIIKSFFCVLFI